MRKRTAGPPSARHPGRVPNPAAVSRPLRLRALLVLTAAAARIRFPAADCINIPFMANDATNADYLAAKKFVVLPFIRAFKPELIIVSAGFDAAAGEVEFRTMLLTPEGFAEMTALLMEIAPVAMALEVR